MGILNWFAKPHDPSMARLPSGSFTVDAQGRLLTSTLPQSFSTIAVNSISRIVLDSFSSAKKLEIPMNEIIADFGGLKLTARELRGGAIVFLSPKSLTAQT